MIVLQCHCYGDKNDEKAATIAELIGHLEQKKQELDKVEAAAKIAVKRRAKINFFFLCLCRCFLFL